jgi:hypothetical protein
MRKAFLTCAFIVTAAISASAQTSPSNTTSASSTSPTASATPEPQPTPWKRLDADKRLKRYVNSMFGPFSIARAVAAAGLSTATNSPEEWGPHWDGFGKRFASNMGRSVIKNTMIYGLDEAFKYDSFYHRSQKRDTGSRVFNAVISPVTARDQNGKRVFGIPRVVSTYASSVIVAETWYPGRTWKDGLRNGTTTLGINAGYNLIKEFIWKK